MKCNLLGLEGVDYTKKDGTRSVGLSLHVSKNPPASKTDMFKGLAVETIWISQTRTSLFEKCKAFPVPAIIDVQYEMNGRFAELVDVILVENGGERK